MGRKGISGGVGSNTLTRRSGSKCHGTASSIGSKVSNATKLRSGSSPCVVCLPFCGAGWVGAGSTGCPFITHRAKCHSLKGGQCTGPIGNQPNQGPYPCAYAVEASNPNAQCLAIGQAESCTPAQCKNVSGVNKFGIPVDEAGSRWRPNSPGGEWGWYCSSSSESEDEYPPSSSSSSSESEDEGGE